MATSTNAKHQFNIGDIVTLKSHPLAFQSDGLIFSFPNYIPPFMCVKEIHVERKKKKFSSTHKDFQVADNVKYLCVYFSQRNFKFEEKFIYESMLLKLSESNFTFHKNESKDKVDNEASTQRLIEETLRYSAVKYKFGKRVFFKTYKLELRKKFKQSEYQNDADERKTFSQKYIFMHTSPALILSGFKKNEGSDIYDETKGNLIKKVATDLCQVTYYNEKQEKISHEYLPKEFLTDDNKIMI